MEQRVRPCGAFHGGGFPFARFLVRVSVRFVGAVVNERLLALQRSLVENDVVDKQVGEPAPLDGVAVGIVRGVKLVYAGVIETVVCQFRDEAGLRFEYLFQLLFVVFALYRAHEFALDFLFWVDKQGVVDVFAYGLS